MSRRCYYYKGVLIPQCGGGVMYGDKRHCYCPPPEPKPERLDRLEEELDELKFRIAELERQHRREG